MDFDVESHLASMTRSVSWLERDAKPASAVKLSRSYASTLEDLWDAVTNRARIPRWFMPITGRLERGGRYQLEGNAGGVITACTPTSHLALTWEFGEDLSWVEVHLSGEGGNQSQLTLTHTAQLSEHWDTYGPGAVGVGWEMGLMGLAIYLAQPDEPKMDEMAFAMSPQGRALIAGSSEGWEQAAMAAGADPEHARAAAQRTTAFYTGESVEPE